MSTTKLIDFNNFSEHTVSKREGKGNIVSNSQSISNRISNHSSSTQGEEIADFDDFHGSNSLVSLKVIARKLGCTPKVVKRLINQAMTKMRQEMLKKSEEERKSIYKALFPEMRYQLTPSGQKYLRNRLRIEADDSEIFWRNIGAN